MIKFTCTSCQATIDTDRDLVRVPRIDAQDRIGSTTTEYRCGRCGALYALRLKAIGVLAYIAATPFFMFFLVSHASEVAARIGRWVGRVAYHPIQTLPPNKSFKPKPLRGSA